MFCPSPPLPGIMFSKLNSFNRIQYAAKLLFQRNTTFQGWLITSTVALGGLPAAPNDPISVPTLCPTSAGARHCRSQSPSLQVRRAVTTQERRGLQGRLGTQSSPRAAPCPGQPRHPFHAGRPGQSVLNQATSPLRDVFLHSIYEELGRLANNAYKYLQGGCQEDGARLFPVVPSDRTRGNRHKLKHRKLQLNTRKNFFPLRVTEPWPRLPRDVVESPLEIFKTHLDTVLCSLLWVTLLGQGVGLGDPQRALPTPTIVRFCEITRKT